MAQFVHLTPAKNARRIRRAGIAMGDSFGTRPGVYCTPILPSYTLSHQWLRELRRGGQRAFVAVHFRIDDDEAVTVGHYSDPDPRWTRAAEAIGMVWHADDPRGYEIVVPRPIRRAELTKVRRVSQVTGWRYLPDAHGRRPCPCPVCLTKGEYKAADIRRRYRHE
ncbi:MAG TPA: hypothetical protein VF053_10000 [Streptosporangiales bacterium]